MSEREGLLFLIGYTIPIVIFVAVLLIKDWYTDRKEAKKSKVRR